MAYGIPSVRGEVFKNQTTVPNYTTNKNSINYFTNRSNQLDQTNLNSGQVPSQLDTKAPILPLEPKQTLPLGLDRFEYTSAPVGTAELIIPPATDRPYIVAAVPTPQEAEDLVKAHVANVFTEPWQKLIEDAVRRNGGLGNEQDGYLAFSKIGFVRLNNPNLTPEQNKRLAAISLQMGVQIEHLPARADKSTSDDPDTNKWVNEFIGKYETKFDEFIKDPSKEMTVKDGKRRYILKLDQESGMVISHYYKKKGGIRGFIQDNFKVIGKVLDGITFVGRFIPGWGTIAAAGAQALKFVAGAIATGKLKAKQLFGSVVSFASNYIPGAASFGQFIKAGVDYAGRAIASGKLKARELLSSVVSSFGGYFSTGSKLGDTLLNNAIDVGANAIERGKFSKSDLQDFATGSLTDIGKSVLDDAKDAFMREVNGPEGGPKLSLSERIKNGITAATDRLSDAGGEFWEGLTGAVSGVGTNLLEGADQIAGGFGTVFSDPVEGLKEIGLGITKTTVQTPLDAILFAGGKTASAATTLLYQSSLGRELTEEEANLANLYFQDGLDTSQVRIKEGPDFIFGSNGGRPFVLGNTVFIPKGTKLDEDTLTHELTHVWQYQNGGTDYAGEALFYQNLEDATSDKENGAYKITNSLLDGIPWEELNPEQQGEMVRLTYLLDLVRNPEKRLLLNKKKEPVVTVGASRSYYEALAQGYVDVTDNLQTGIVNLQQGLGAT